MHRDFLHCVAPRTAEAPSSWRARDYASVERPRRHRDRRREVRFWFLMFLFRAPSATQVDAFLAESASVPLSYEPTGIALQDDAAGFALDQQITVVGRGVQAFERGRRALAAWRHFEIGWARIAPASAAIEPGTTVAVIVRHLGIWSMNGCRVVYRLGAASTTEFGFAYGTLANHAEAGEEIFRVAYDDDTGDVSYTIRAVSRPRAALARLGYPVARSLQARFRRDSARALARAVAQHDWR